jgi:hypothetical protein
MDLDHNGRVGDFTRLELRRVVFNAYRSLIQDAFNASGTDELNKATFQKQLARFGELESQWIAAWFQLGLGQAPNAPEQDDRENVLLRIEAQLAQDCPGIFKRSYYVPVQARIQDDLKI